jgi:hypothetical protein
MPHLAAAVGEGFAVGLSRPGRNVTGFINMEASMSAPGGGSYYLDPFNAAAQSLGLETIAAHVS